MAYPFINLGDLSGLSRVLPCPGSCGMDTASSPAYCYKGRDRQRDSGVQVFQYSLTGCGRISIKGVEHPVPAGRGFLCNLYDPEAVYFYPPTAREPWSFVYLTFRNAEAWVQAVHAAAGPVHAIPREGAFLQQLERLCRRASGSRELTMEAGLELISQLFVEICRAMDRAAPRSRGQRLARQAIAVMQGRVESADGVTEIAARVGVSVEHLCRVFRQELKVTPLAYFQRLKLSHTAALLRDGDMPIKEVAQRLGISNVANFTRLFTHHMGVSPGKFRDGVGPVVEPLSRR